MRRSLLAAILLLAFIFTGAIGAPPAGAVAPANDNLGAALEVAFQPYTNVQTNIDATLEVGENAAYNACQGEYTGAGNMTSTVWYKYTHLGSPATLQVDTLGPGTMDAVIRIATGPSSSPTHGSLTEIACGDQEWGDSWAAATFSAATGQTYYIQVGTYSGFPPGTFALNISPINSTAGTRFTVTSNADTGDATPDGACDSGGACTLREAIQEANALVGTDVITFEAGGGSPVTIAPATPLPVVSGVVLDARTENAFAGTPAVVLDGVSANTGLATGFQAQLFPISVRGLVIGRFVGNAFFIQSNNNVIQGNYLGVGLDGETDMGNLRAVYVTGGRSGNIIGGTTPSARNIISGNTLGAFLDGSSAAVTNNQVIGNYIGTNAFGTTAVQNDDSGILVYGVAPAGATGNIIGESTVTSLPSGGRNVISGNDGDGIQILGSAATGNTVAGNVIGLNAAGTAAIPNTGRGVNIAGGASSNTVGGTAAYARNVISGNALDGVRIADAGTSNSVIGNYVGTDAAGNVDLGNGGAGIAIENAPGNTIGGSSAGAPNPPGNVVSGNIHGITIFGEAADGNVVQGNVVGLNTAGNAALGNSDVGIWVLGGADNNIIGGTVPGARNVSSANARGIAVFDTGTTGNTVQGNYAGTNLAGTAAVGNASEGVGVGYGASGNTVGGAAAGAGNVLSGNGQNGVRIGEGNASNNNTVAGNYIGTNAAGTSAVANGTIGAWVLTGSTGNTIGDDNVISGNTGNGVQIDASNGNTVRGNHIGTNASGTAAVANGTNGVLISGSSSNTIGGSGSDARNVISGNASAGVSVSGGGSNTIKGNYIGLAADGQSALANAGNGIRLDGGALSNVLGGVVAAEANVISANTLSGVQVTGESTDGNLLIGNLIGTDAAGTLDRGNTLDGVRIDGGADSTGMGNGAGGGNVISGNGTYGIAIIGDGSTGTEIWGNKIGTNSAGTAAIANSENGVLVWGAVNTSIGGNTAEKRNVISGNASLGIFILPQVTGLGATGNAVKGNYIGTAADGVAPLGNGSHGINLFFAPSNSIGGTGAGDGNTIAYNGGNGVTVNQVEASGNLIRRNSIHSNGFIGIDLINGGNGGILPPTILSFNPPAAEVVGETCPFCTVEVFSDSADEGRVYQGTTTADFLGDWVVSASFLGPNITATTTNGGNTSEFSAPFACPDSDADTVCDAGDNCPAVANTSQSNADGDALGDHCDTSDTDGDGFTDQTEARYVGTNAGYPCGFNSWPADLLDQGPLSANKITLQDLASFVAPVRHLNTNLGDGNFSARWDLVPGKGTFPNTINLQDMAAIVILAPPMLNGARALNGPVCPMPSQ